MNDDVASSINNKIVNTLLQLSVVAEGWNWRGGSLTLLGLGLDNIIVFMVVGQKFLISIEDALAFLILITKDCQGGKQTQVRL